jgi:cytoskeletal protein RodZ
MNLCRFAESEASMATLGEELKRERELREISLREISQATKISMRILEAIEKNNFKVMPGGIFNKNFIRAYAEFIGVDPDNAVNKYHQQATTLTENPLPEFHGVINIGQSTSPSRTKRIVLICILVLVAACLVAYGYFRFKKSLPHTTSILPGTGSMGWSLLNSLPPGTA